MIMRTIVWSHLPLLFAAAAFAAEPTSPSSAPPAAVTNEAGPHITFAEPIFDFGQIRNGELVKHSYMFTNTGNDVLEVTHVQPSCGCTSSGEWTRKVESGKTGVIPVQFDSSHFNGPVFKTVSVTSNDKRQPTSVLQLKGTIWKPVDFFPAYAVLSIPPDAASHSMTVRITNNLAEPITLSNPVCTNESFKAEVQTDVPGKAYHLTVTAIPPMKPGSVTGKILIPTSSKEVPTLEVPFWANVQAPVIVLPPQLYLQPAPLAVRTTNTVTIQGNGTNLFEVSDAALNAAGVEVNLRTIQPGRIYSYQLIFPQGFAAPAGQPLAFTAKSTHPGLPNVRVPIMQIQRPAVPAQARTLPPVLKTQATATQ